VGGEHHLANSQDASREAGNRFTLRELQLMENGLFYYYYSVKGEHRGSYRTELSNIIQKLSKQAAEMKALK
jgi:hypothetical protein